MIDPTAWNDPTPWNVFHDGTIVGLERDLADTVTVAIECAYLRDRFADGGTRFLLHLVRCTRCVYEPFDEPPIDDLAAIASCEPGLLEARAHADELVVGCDAGLLRLRYEALTIALDTGRPIQLEELTQVAGAYWDQLG